MTKRKVDWEQVDWSLQDVEIAERYGVSKQRVWGKRKALGMPKARTHAQRRRKGKPRARSARRLRTERFLRGLGREELTKHQVAERLGESASYVSNVAFQLGVRLARPHKYAWDSVTGWAERTDSDIAQEVGCAPASVNRYRRRHGLPLSPLVRGGEAQLEHLARVRPGSKTYKGYSIEQARVLAWCLRLGEPFSQEDYRRVRSLKKPSGILNRYAAKGWLERLPGPDGVRSVRYRVTEAGRSIVREYRDRLEQEGLYPTP